MRSTAVRVEGLWKDYVIGGRGRTGVTFREALLDTLSAPFRRLSGRGGRAEESRRFWALQDVSFEIPQGEVVGIVGRNGAGKSTLLKILSRITAPTEGRAEIRGRVGALLEVGTGFHPELTGRENVFLNGAILGMRRDEIARKFDEIVDFSGVETFIDTPVKRYSSGMQVRLAFAVAAHLEPEILLVDEVLAVGDAEFQKKCLGKMSEIAERRGRTVLFVSHNLSAVGALCRTGVLLDQGRLLHTGEVRDVLVQYVQAGGALSQYERSAPAIADATLMSGRATYEIDGTTGRPIIRLQLRIDAKQAMPVSIGVRIRDVLGASVGYVPIGAFNQDEVLRLARGDNEVDIAIPAQNFATGSYLLSIDIALPNIIYYDRAEDCLSVDIEGLGGDGRKKSLEQAWGWGSLVLPPSRIDVTRAAG